ncbi:hypothetical protein [Bradyrhizobium sp. WSM471]|uniref:hypothetical protein n=1 Tax=Bradyrhizobium sp. WSM471 TaxID=319017 RepID=UPI00024D2346|nr:MULTISPECIES: hypothetical protein [Bradyrhizobium]EHR00824.1 hypothetical protein Bra471DRAFT_01420 [Bradyrhizobium sp. WSM471]UFW42904.1 hypothetical protein BcanWSM471_06935 [Bradyrhizobium canariense]
MPYFHCSSTMLEPGAVILPGNWGRIVRLTGWPYNQAFREAVFEYVRDQEFAQKPSRLDSLFFFDDEYEARFYATSDARQATMLPYEIELLDAQAPKHFADWRNLQPQTPLVDRNRVRDHWSGQMLPLHRIDDNATAAFREVIAVTPARIIRRI